MNTLEVGSQMAATEPLYVIPPPFQGIGVLRYPVGYTPTTDGTMKDNRDIAQGIAESMEPGSTLAFPNTRDYMGDYEWDFRIEGGPVDQVRIERTPESPSDGEPR